MKYLEDELMGMDFVWSRMSQTLRCLILSCTNGLATSFYGLLKLHNPAVFLIDRELLIIKKWRMSSAKPLNKFPTLFSSDIRGETTSHSLKISSVY